MLSCLNEVTAQLAKIESEYHRFNFNEPGVTIAFMQMTRPILVQAQTFSKIANSTDYRQDLQFMAIFNECPNIYIPTIAEINEYHDVVEDFNKRAKALHDRFALHIPSTLATYVKLASEVNAMFKKQAVVPTKKSQPTVLYLKDAEESKLEKKEKSKDAPDEGVSFFKNVGCFNKKK